MPVKFFVLGGFGFFFEGGGSANFFMGAGIFLNNGFSEATFSLFFPGFCLRCLVARMAILGFTTTARSVGSSKP